MLDIVEKDEMDDLIEVVLNVLQIADEWLMDRLKDICEQVLGEQGKSQVSLSIFFYSNSRLLYLTNCLLLFLMLQFEQKRL